MAKFYWFSVSLVLLQLFGIAFSGRESVITPPLPILPIPSASQLKWQQRELIMFLHFGVNTYTGAEWGTGQEDPSIFNPVSLNANQWVDVAAEAEISLMILTAKHHDGFCLWPSKYTDHSVASSPWKSGTGDVVKEFVDAASKNKKGIDVGFFLSPWDLHDKRYGNELEYNQYFLAQLQELLTRYGSVQEIWFTGSKGWNAPDMSYYFQDYFAMVKGLQSSINIFSDAGPDVRWVGGGENDYIGTMRWSTINRTSVTIGDGSIVRYLDTGDPRGTDWVPAECDVSIRQGWFWHESEEPKSLKDLLSIYYDSVGRNCVMLLNVPPNTSGLISDSDRQRLKEFRKAINTIFSINVAEGRIITASSQRGGKMDGFGPENVLDNDHLWTYWAPADSSKNVHWIEIRGKKKHLLRFNVVRIQEAIGLGQRIIRHAIYIDGKCVANGTTVGYKRLHKLEQGVVHAKQVRILIQKSRGLPLISSIGLHFDPYWDPKANHYAISANKTQA